jgi:hypothetical protein
MTWTNEQIAEKDVKLQRLEQLLEALPVDSLKSLAPKMVTQAEAQSEKPGVAKHEEMAALVGQPGVVSECVRAARSFATFPFLGDSGWSHARHVACVAQAAREAVAYASEGEVPFHQYITTLNEQIAWAVDAQTGGM